MKVEDVPLPGFRLHPIYEELVGFNLRRRVENKPVKIQLIKRMDIYRYDRWDLPRAESEGQSESYFFCKRGSIGTALDRIGLPDRGFGKQLGLIELFIHMEVNTISALGKGTKTDWMMHEFRLPREDNHTDTIQKARKVSSHRKYREDWREIAAKHKSIAKTRRCPTISLESKNGHENYIKFGAPIIHQHYDEEKQQGVNQINGIRQLYRNVAAAEQLNRIAQHPLFASSSSFSNQESYFFTDANWDELRSVVEFADIDPFLL
ncbi:hypothetical protein GOBAR_AA00288 [Gossypium barbadense]|uniref:NAC domain-containing protein n=1 Tax=Gossypium barbadense TaxID=3634 RepID=A0A2P5YXJ5_GOSBA|nr:hypothetical protein GOBAR_AA00288 [Gossypium barbadense]